MAEIGAMYYYRNRSRLPSGPLPDFGIGGLVPRPDDQGRLSRTILSLPMS